VNPDYIGRLFDVTLGQIMLGAAIVMMISGYAWMMKIIKIEI
jgi:Flp pilus assembly protein TadB